MFQTTFEASKEIAIKDGPGIAKAFPVMATGVIVGVVGAALIIEFGMFVLGGVSFLVALQTFNVGYHMVPDSDEIPFFHRWAR